MTHDPNSFPLHDLADFKAWQLQEPNAAKLLKEIIHRWRGSSARVRGDTDKWAVYHVDQWAEWTGLSRKQTKTALGILELDGLIVRSYHKFNGPGVFLYVKPTRLALKYMGRPQDLARLDSKTALADAPDKEPKLAPDKGPDGGPDGGPDDYTSFPSLLHSNSPTTLQAPPHTCEEGKGKAGENAGVKKKLKVKSNPKPAPEDDFEQQYAAFKAKQTEKTLKHFPKLKGPHEAKVKHPADCFPNWTGYSVEVQAKLYARYELYVKNYNEAAKAKATGFGKSYVATVDLSEEEIEAGYQAAMVANTEWLENSGL